MKIHINGRVFFSYTAHWYSCIQLTPKSICILNISYWFIQSGRDAALTVLSVALSSALKLWSWHRNGIVPPWHDQKANHLFYAVNDEIATHFLKSKIKCNFSWEKTIRQRHVTWSSGIYLRFFVMLDEFFGWETVKTAEFWFDHDRNVTQRLFDDSFGNAINRPTHVCLGKHTKKILFFFLYWCLLTGFALGKLLYICVYYV